MSVKFTGVDQLIRRLAKAGAVGVSAAHRGIDEFAVEILAKSTAIIPYDKGELQGAIIDEPIRNGVKVIGYDKPYAAKQHEDTSLTHPGPRSTSPERGAKGEPKYLENPIKQNIGHLRTAIERQLNRAL